MNTLSQRMKTYATGALLLVVLLSPLQSSAALMTTNEVNALRDQVAQVSEAVESAPGIPMQKRSELRAVIETINNLIALLALQAAADPNAVYNPPVRETQFHPASSNAQSNAAPTEPKDDFTITYD